MTTDQPTDSEQVNDADDFDDSAVEIYGHLIEDDDDRAPTSQNMREWLDRLTVSLVGEAERAPKAGDQGIIYSIKLGKEKAWGSDVAIGIGVAKRLKSGLWGAPKDITNACAPPESIRGAYEAIDHQLARELMATTHAKDGYYYYRNKALNGEPESGDLLKRIVETGRARLVGKGMVQWSTSRNAHYTYIEEDQQQWRVSITSLRSRVLLTCPPCYIDLEQQCCGPMAGLDPRAVPLLYQAPPIPSQDLPAIHSVLQQFLPSLLSPNDNPEPAPTAQFAYALIDGYVTIHAASAAQHWDMAGEVLLPLVRYGDHLLPLGDQRATSQRSGSVITRDLVREQQHIQQLKALGLFQCKKHLRFEANGQLQRQQDVQQLCWVHLGEYTPTSRPRSSGPDYLSISSDLLAQLQAAGWQQLLENGDMKSAEIVLADHWNATVNDEEDSSWFDVSLGIEINGEEVDSLPILRQLAALSEESIQNLPKHDTEDAQRVLLPLDDKRLVALPITQVMELYRALIELFTASERRIQLTKWDFEATESLERLGSRWQGSPRLKNIQHELRRVAERGLDTIPQLSGLQATLRPYQEHGVQWLSTLRRLNLGGLLADDMGLGKTIQTLAFIQLQRQQEPGIKPVLVIAPVSTLGNWEREAKRFTPDVRCHRYHGPQRNHIQLQNPRFHVFLTSYATLLRDQKHFQPIEWSLVVCDEAQSLKNPQSQQGKAIRELHSEQRLALSGTPMENHLGELWALMHWVEPGLLGSRAQFERSFRSPIEKLADRQRQEALARRIAPVILRRTKENVLTELPERIEMIHRLELGNVQATLYESIRAAMDDQVREAIAAKGISGAKLEFLEALLRLRQICCHPPLVPTRSAQECQESAKLDFLRNLLPELIAEGRRILVFSQFTSLLNHIQALCVECSLPLVRLDGSTSNRQAVVDRFQDGDVPLFLISLKAGGMGLNLTSADTVILTDPWWNPAVEQQAIDRAHRMGQKNPVFVHRLIVSGSIEERVLELQEHKRNLADGLYQADGQSLGALSEDDLSELMKPLDPAFS